jgi:signal transduction histidine kinase/CheY-like chemotaxis protein/ligand-binding sensor domain-containing protein/AraC-like DNA-binding protein
MKRKEALFYRNSILALLLLGGWATFSSAQTYQVQPDTIADGLSQGMIYDILQDRDGFLWVATKDGLNRFDGYRFEVFTNDPFDPFSIGNNESVGLFEDKDGNIWITSSGGILGFYERSSGKFYHLSNWNGKPNVLYFESLAQTPDGAIWVGKNRGLLRLTRKEGNDGSEEGESSEISSLFNIEEVLLPGLDPNAVFVTTLASDADGTLLLVCLNEAAFTLNPNSRKANRLSFAKGGFWHKIDSFGKRQFMSSSENTLEVKEGDLVKEIPPPNGTRWSHIHFSDGKGNLILGLQQANKHFSILTIPEQQLFEKGAIASAKLLLETEKTITAACLDRTGNLWLGTDGYGLLKVKTNSPPFHSILSGHSIRQIFADNTAVILQDYSVSKTILYRYDFSNKTSPIAIYEQPQPDPRLGKRLKTKSGIEYRFAYVGSYFNTVLESNELPPKQYKFELIFFENSPLLEDSRGRIWLGGDKAKLACLDVPSGKFTYFDLTKYVGGNTMIFTLFEDALGLWVGTNNGLVNLKIAQLQIGKHLGQTISEFPAEHLRVFKNDPKSPNSLRYNFVSTLCADPLEPDHYLWVGTKGGGLNLLDKTTGTFTHFTSKNSGLPNDVVYGLLPDDANNIWGSTNRGLFRLSLSNAAKRQPATLPFLKFTKADGLQDDEFNTSAFAKLPDGQLIFGGVNGATIFNPLAIKEPTSDAAIHITGLKINNSYVSQFSDEKVLSSPIHLTERIRLQNTQNLVTIEFSLMDFTNPAGNRYRYRLLGADPDWVESDNSHVANYSRLRPGNYTFEVQGSVGGGKWSAPATLSITVLPPWWASWWAYLLYVLAIGAVLYAFYKTRLRQKLEHQESLRLKELDTFKSRFFTNITHEFRTPLTVILGMTERLAADGGRLTEPEAKNKLGLIKRNGESLLRLINQILDLSKLESNSLKINYIQGDVLPYLRYISESLHSFANAQNVMVRVESPEPEIVMDYDPERLLQIVHNLLSNAIKFTPSGGKVTLFVGMRDEESGMKGQRTSSLIPHPSSLIPHSSSLVLTVSDTGVGIPPEDLPNIFDRFFQADNHRHTKANGTGIGLSLTKELVRAMGGDIRVESEMGRGTTFTVQLPIVQSPPEKSGQALTPKGEPHPGSSISNSAEFDGLGSPLGLRLLAKQIDGQEGLSHEGSPSILLIEDNPDVVEYLAACLSSPLAGGREGAYQLDFAYNGRAGIEKALETVPDLIISDVMMPEKDGFEVCDTLKNDERTSHIPIILLTAKADIESRIAGLKRGADAYLAKPFHQEELLVTVGNLLELRRKLQARYGKLEIGKRPALPEDREIDVVPGDSSLMPHSSSLEEVFLQKLNAQIAERLADVQFDGPQLARAMGLSEVQLYRKIKALTDKSTAIYIRSVRLSKGRELLLNTNKNVSEVAYEVGFDNPSYFSRTFSQEFGIAPSDLRK